MTAGSKPSSKAGRQLVWQLVDKLDEQRRQPRIPLVADARLRTAAGTLHAARIVNVSPDGLQLRCDVASARGLRPVNGRFDAANAPVLEVSLELPVGETRRALTVSCQLLYLTTVDSEPRCVFGLRFIAPDRASEATVNAFFANQMGLDGACA